MAELSNEEILELVDCITVQVQGFTDSVNRMIEGIEGAVNQLKKLNNALAKDQAGTVVKSDGITTGGFIHNASSSNGE